MADAPSPYAPGLVSDEPAAPPRPAGRPVIFLVATFVTTLLVSGLWRLWASRGRESTGSSNAGFATLSSVPAALMLLWAYLSDAVPLGGTRREGYLLVAVLMMAAAWLAVGSGSITR